MENSCLNTKQSAYNVIFGVSKGYIKYAAVLMYGIILQAKDNQLMQLSMNATRGGGKQ